MAFMKEINFEVNGIETIDLSLGMGIKEIYPPIDNLEVMPTKEERIFTHEGSYGYDEVKVKPIPDEYIIPEGTLPITENATYDVTNYARVSASVHPAPNLQDKSITINENGTHSIKADEEYDGLNQVNVTVDAIEDLTEELNTYNNELTEQETTIENIVENLKNKVATQKPKLQEKVVTITKNGTGEITPDEEYDGLSKVVINTEIQVESSVKKYAPKYITFYSYKGTDLDYELSNLDYSNLESMNYMFNSCSNMTSISLKGLNVPKATSMSSMFGACTNLNTIDLSGLNVPNVTNMGSLCANCKQLTSIDFSGLNVPNLTAINNMFQGCSGLTSLDLSNLNVSNVGNFGSVFSNCSKLTTLNVSNWDVGNATSMSSLFNGCSLLDGIDLSNWKPTKLTGNALNSMFYGCSALTSVDISGFESSGSNMSRMFYNCTVLSDINFGNLSTDDVTDMSYMFYNCKGLTRLDISNFTTTSITTNANMFYGCSNLRTLIINTPNEFKITASSAFTGSGIANGACTVYVPDNLVSKYKSANFWSNYGSRIKGISELPQEEV
jgi:surface protein